MLSRKLFAIIGLASGFYLGPVHVQAHDVYNNLRDVKGQLCCGGDPVTGDCEALTYEDVHEVGDGTWAFKSRRYGAVIRVAEEMITWMPVAGSDEPVHWCGVPRSKVPMAPVDGLHPDLAWWSYCAFVSPGGV